MTHQPAPFETETVTTLEQVVMESPGTSTLTAHGKIITWADPDGSTSWADVTISDGDCVVEAVVQPDAAQARMLAAYFLNLADALEGRSS